MGGFPQGNSLEANDLIQACQSEAQVQRELRRIGIKAELRVAQHELQMLQEDEAAELAEQELAAQAGAAEAAEADPYEDIRVSPCGWCEPCSRAPPPPCSWCDDDGDDDDGGDDGGDGDTIVGRDAAEHRRLRAVRAAQGGAQGEAQG